MYIVDFGLCGVERIVCEVCRRVMRLSSIVFGACLRMLRLPSSVYFRSIDVFLEETESSILFFLFSVYVRLRGLLYVYCRFGLGDVESIVREVCRRVMRLSSIVFGSCLR